jgi:stress response protein YsnF
LYRALPANQSDFFNTHAWSDKAYEMTETAEQALVSKSARVVEEVTLRKTGTDRVETVKDTVRRQQVEVEKVDANR